MLSVRQRSLLSCRPAFSLTLTRYRLLRSWFTTSPSPFWQTFDPFFGQKMDTLKSSGDAIYRALQLPPKRIRFEPLCIELATTLYEVGEEKNTLESDPDKLGVLFKEMVQMCLWYVFSAFYYYQLLDARFRGNATDLSLLTNLSHSDIQDLQSVGRDAQEKRKGMAHRAFDLLDYL